MTNIQDPRRLTGSKIVVTGATGGLGFSVSLALAREGADVIAIGRDKKRLEDLSDAIEQTRGTSTLVCIDLAKQGTIEELSQKVSKKFGELNVIIHCAMCSLQMMPINQVSLKEIEINLLSPITICFRLISCFHGLLSKDHKGLFMYISDTRKTKFNSLYNSAKKACDQLLLSYKEENKRLGIDVLIHYPQPMRTNLRKKMFPGEEDIDSNSINREAKKIIGKVLVFTKRERIIT